MHHRTTRRVLTWTRAGAAERAVANLPQNRRHPRVVLITCGAWTGS